ncbi:MAG: sigma-70 family RNA polymerase sigma factor [Candidatus Krumholzibacteria bacterium]|nr:sigma-70 family RNA polymerase sigma factor [Candidatus Krumholzibacteria bacterium]
MVYYDGQSPAPADGEAMAERKEENRDPATWVDDHGDALFRYAILRVKDETTAEDLVQETFLSALKAIDGFQGGSALRTWLVGILKHKIIDHYRKSRPEVLASDLGPNEDESHEHRLERAAEAPALQEWAGSPSSLLENQRFWEVFSGCLDELPEAHRRAFSLREIDGYKGDEICKILDITSTNLWVILHRARNKLRACLQDNWFGAR